MLSESMMKYTINQIVDYYVNFIKSSYDESINYYDLWDIFYEYLIKNIEFSILDEYSLSVVSFEYLKNWHNKDGIYYSEFLYFKFPEGIEYENRLEYLIEYLVMKTLCQ